MKHDGFTVALKITGNNYSCLQISMKCLCQAGKQWTLETCLAFGWEKYGTACIV